ncbi:hypothetical protein TEA_018145 [Camellia sinensis var. sinensis]|uniref:F-box domain-containing protein n=1 Tax=Camellia sinensis var. sinensis TaxID=542762 RepID=A0A4S4EYK4_CAMSN|nr:hypothetical protein TEA_018145 [Camellia sinensis var. sinensis]
MQRVRISSHQAPVHKLGDSQMTLSPKFKLAAIQSSLLHPCLDLELYQKGKLLIPGLPDDIALNCLLRVPVLRHPPCRVVCKRWYLLFSSKDRFFTLRKELGFRVPWLFVFAFHKCTGKIQWQVLDLTHLSWHALPPMPCKDKHESTKLKVYDTDTDSWDPVQGPPLPAQICKPFSVNCTDSRIFVVGRNLHVAVGDISRLNPGSKSEKKWSFSVRWQVVDAPEAFSDLTPSSAQVLIA